MRWLRTQKLPRVVAAYKTSEGEFQRLSDGTTRLAGPHDEQIFGRRLPGPKPYGVISALSVFMDLINEHRVILWVASFLAGIAYAHFFGGPWR